MIESLNTQTDGCPGLTASSLHLAYHGVTVVADATVRLDPGRVLALVGPNGSGKSTLLRALARLHRPAARATDAGGVVGFVGLVTPHMARALVGNRHVRMVPIAALLGALLVSMADTVGRTVVSPAQIPAGLLVALLGAPYFVWLLWRSRTG